MAITVTLGPVNATASSSTTCTISLGSCTAGRSILVAVLIYRTGQLSAAVSSVAINGESNATLIGSLYGFTGYAYMQFAKLPLITTSGAKTVTVTISNGATTYWRACAVELAGADTTTMCGTPAGASGATGMGGDKPACSLLTTVDHSAIFSFVSYDYAAGGPFSGDGYTAIAFSPVSLGYQYDYGEYKLDDGTIATKNVRFAVAGTAFSQIAVEVLPATGAPTLSSISPTSGLTGATTAVTLTGVGFSAGSAAISAGCTLTTGGGVTVTGLTVASDTSITANFVVTGGATTGARTVSVTTTNGTSGTVTFTINSPPLPTLTSVTPNTGAQNSITAVTLTGTGFSAGSAAVNVSGTGVAVGTPTVVNDTSITVNLTIDVAAALTARNVTVTTVNGTSTPAITFTVTSVASPVLTSITPSNGYINTTQPVTLTGTALSGTTPVIGGTVNGTGISVANLVQVSNTTVTLNLVIGPAVTAGPRTIYLQTDTGTSNSLSFTVLARGTGGSSGTPISFRGNSFVAISAHRE